MIKKFPYNQIVIGYEADCANIGQYHAKLGQRLPHILFFCDEVTEMLEKTGISKAQKEKVLEIEGMLCTSPGWAAPSESP